MKELNEIQHKVSVEKSQQNTFGKYSYRNIDDILRAVKPLVKEANCSLTLDDEIVMIGDRFYAKSTATLTNDKGDAVSVKGWAREQATKKGMDESQITGTAETYARKTALTGLFAIDDSKDADSYQPEQQDVTQGGLPPRKSDLNSQFVMVTKLLAKKHGMSDDQQIYDQINDTFNLNISELKHFAQLDDETKWNIVNLVQRWVSN